MHDSQGTLTHKVLLPATPCAILNTSGGHNQVTDTNKQTREARQGPEAATNQEFTSPEAQRRTGNQTGPIGSQGKWR